MHSQSFAKTNYAPLDFVRSAFWSAMRPRIAFVSVSPNDALATQKSRINTPVIISASIHTKSMLNHARRNIATPSFS